MVHRPQALAKKFMRWQEASSIARPSGTSNHDHGELVATSAIVELRVQPPNGWLLPYRALNGAYATTTGIAGAVTAAVNVAVPTGNRSNR